jgi:hypothetical protein
MGPADLALVKSAALATMRIEKLESATLRGEVSDDSLTKLLNVTTRIFAALRVQRQKRKPAHVPPWKESK